MIELELFEIDPVNQLRLLHLMASFFGALFLMLVWYQNQKLTFKTEQDWGLVLIAFALIMWCAADAYKFLRAIDKGQDDLITKLFSTFNNGFFIASLPYFDYGFEKLKKLFPVFKKGTTWALFVLLFNILLMLLYTMAWAQNEKENYLVKHFDVFYSILTFIALGYAITRSFQKRHQYGKPFMIMSIVITVLSVLPQLVFSPFLSIVHKDIFAVMLQSSNVALITLLLVLAQSWVVEESIKECERTISNLESQKSALSAEIANQQAQIQVLKETIRNEAVKKESIATEEITTEIPQREKLTKREMEILKCISENAEQTYDQIADKTFIARNTIITHVRNIENKLGIRGKDELAKYARSHGIA
ncbi:MAG: LuxR C-terminal-related transcriptional regulator [Bacteroidia bacterium]|nr:LuxR C-terminal-related transcriptional regulator [Bacteroidia bacterium]